VIDRGPAGAGAGEDLIERLRRNLDVVSEIQRKFFLKAVDDKIKQVLFFYLAVCFGGLHILSKQTLPLTQCDRLNLVEYCNTTSEYHDLVQFGLVHYQFETIHPFKDGNGRLGRILITLQLIQNSYLTQPYLYPSAYFNRNKIEYADRMRTVSETGAWEPWLEFFVEGIRSQAAEAVARTNDLRTLRREYERTYGHEKTAADRLAMRLFKQPYVTTNDVAELLDVTAQTARNVIQELEAQDILTETTGKERYQEFKAVDIFDTLNQPLE